MILDKQIALVTGASRGIGHAIALALAREGALVIGTGTRPESAELVTSALNAQGAKGCGMVLDVTQGQAIDPLMEEIKKNYGPVSILVNNAGLTKDGLAMRMQDTDWEQVISANLSGVFRLSRAVLRDMTKAKSGRIINISSVVGFSGNPGQINYAAAKAGVVGMSRALAREIGGRGITVNCVAPGFIETDMTSKLSPQQVEALKAQIPLGRLGTVADIAAAVVFLSSPSAGYITGTTLHVNGGMYM